VKKQLKDLARSTLLMRLRKAGDAAQDAADGRLNYGGCCVYAAMVAWRLRSQGIPAVIVMEGIVEHSGIDKLAEARVELGRIHEIRDDLYVEHVKVKFRHQGVTYIHDSERTQMAAEHRREWCGVLTRREAARLARTADGWNDSFDRSAMPAIGKVVREYL
jgi:hypothetical protein